MRSTPATPCACRREGNQPGCGSRLTLGGHSSVGKTGKLDVRNILTALMQPRDTLEPHSQHFLSGDCSLILSRIVLLRQCSLVFTHKLIHAMLTSVELDTFVES